MTPTTLTILGIVIVAVVLPAIGVVQSRRSAKAIDAWRRKAS